jgi:hypothetical protein
MVNHKSVFIDVILLDYYCWSLVPLMIHKLSLTHGTLTELACLESSVALAESHFVATVEVCGAGCTS